MNEYYLWNAPNPICNNCVKGQHINHDKEIWWVDLDDGLSTIKKCECRECNNAL